jgi:hypothetical protein
MIRTKQAALHSSAFARNIALAAEPQSETVETRRETGSCTSSSVRASDGSFQLLALASEHELPSKLDRLESFRVVAGGCS